MTSSSTKATGFAVISRPTKLCGLAVVIFFIMILVSTGRLQTDHNSTALTTIVGLSLGLFGLSALAGIVMVVVDIGRTLLRTRQVKTSREANKKQQAADHLATQAALFAELQDLYRKHEPTLADSIREMTKPDRYGVRDADLAAREFSHFQDRLVVPALQAGGYDLDDIGEVLQKIGRFFCGPFSRTCSSGRSLRTNRPGSRIASLVITGPDANPDHDSHGFHELSHLPPSVPGQNGYGRRARQAEQPIWVATKERLAIRVDNVA
jgi:hypothetical protein